MVRSGGSAPLVSPIGEKVDFCRNTQLPGRQKCGRMVLILRGALHKSPHSFWQQDFLQAVLKKLKIQRVFRAFAAVNKTEACHSERGDASFLPWNLYAPFQAIFDDAYSVLEGNGRARDGVSSRSRSGRTGEHPACAVGNTAAREQSRTGQRLRQLCVPQDEPVHGGLAPC